MNRRRPQSKSNGLSAGRFLLGTAVVAVVFSFGLIAGQRILVERSLSPVVSAGEPAQAFFLEEADQESSDRSSQRDLFSFYEVLTSTEIQQIMVSAEAGEPERPQPLVDEEPVDEQSEEETESELSDAGFEIDDDAVAHTDDGTQPARFTLQVAAHPSRERARTEMDRLRALGLDPHVVAANVPGRGKFYRVRVGKFATEAEARSHQATLRSGHEVETFLSPL